MNRYLRLENKIRIVVDRRSRECTLIKPNKNFDLRWRDSYSPKCILNTRFAPMGVYAETATTFPLYGGSARMTYHRIPPSADLRKGAAIPRIAHSLFLSSRSLSSPGSVYLTDGDFSATGYSDASDPTATKDIHASCRLKGAPGYAVIFYGVSARKAEIPGAEFGMDKFANLLLLHERAMPGYRFTLTRVGGAT